MNCRHKNTSHQWKTNMVIISESHPFHGVSQIKSNKNWFRFSVKIVRIISIRYYTSIWADIKQCRLSVHCRLNGANKWVKNEWTTRQRVNAKIYLFSSNDWFQQMFLFFLRQTWYMKRKKLQFAIRHDNKKHFESIKCTTIFCTYAHFLSFKF